MAPLVGRSFISSTSYGAQLLFRLADGKNGRTSFARPMRLNRYLARAGVTSRRHAEELILGGQIRINGRSVRELATVVQPNDRVEVRGKAIELPAESTYLLLNKPLGVVTTMRDPQGRATVAALIPDNAGIFPVGRLDYATAGALLLTNDGDLAHRLLHPRFGVEKTYRAIIAGRLSAEDVHRLTHGITLPEFRAGAAKVRVVAVRRDSSAVDVTIHEGRNRQIRRMFEALRHRILSLTRTSFGPLRLGALAPGQFRAVTAKERAALEQYRRPQAEQSRTTSA